MTDMDDLAQVVDRMAQARTVHLVGMRRAYAAVRVRTHKMGLMWNCCCDSGIPNIWGYDE